MPAPTLIQYSDTAFNAAGTGGNSKSTVSFTWQTGDIFVVIAGDEGATASQVLSLPTATGLTFTSLFSVNAGSPAAHPPALAAFAIAGSNGSGVITSSSTPSTTSHWGMAVWQWRNSVGIGNSSGTAAPSATKVVNLTPIAADSAIMWGVFDWAAASVQSGTPTPSNTRRNAVDGTAYTYYIFDLVAQPSTGALNYGIGGAGTGPFSIVAVEVQAASSGTTPNAFDSDEANQISKDVNFSLMQEADDFPTALPPPNVGTQSDNYQPVYTEYIWLGGDE